jgi:hypothetical protein
LLFCFAAKQALLFFATLAEGGKYKRWATLHLLCLPPTAGMQLLAYLVFRLRLNIRLNKRSSLALFFCYAAAQALGLRSKKTSKAGMQLCRPSFISGYASLLALLSNSAGKRSKRS